MYQEIERKFLVAADDWRGETVGVPIRQGYLSRGIGTTVRVRRAGAQARLTIKGPVSDGVRPEFEYDIPAAEAEQLLALCGTALVEKTRYEVPHRGHVWEVDVFEGRNAGLVVAEIELDSVGELVELPDWVGTEVTDDPRYLNASLAERPFRDW